MPESSQPLSRRTMLGAGVGGFLGLNLAGLLQAQSAAAAVAARPQPKPLRACIFIFYYGGPSQLDTYDPKPSAPAEVRGEFRPISTSAPGVQICEHLPEMAKVMHKVALVRSVHHAARLHDSASIHALTGRPLDGPDRELFNPQPQFYPSYGSALNFLRRGRADAVAHAALPFAFRNVHPVPCQGGGFLGSAFDPIQLSVDAAKQRYQIGAMNLPDDLIGPRLGQRHDLLAALNLQKPAQGDATRLASVYDRAFELLQSHGVREAVQIEREPQQVRDRYGYDIPPATVGEGGGGGNGAELGIARQMRGQNLLVARRLVEAGVPFVNVNDFYQQGKNWDAHFKCFHQHKELLLPAADRALAALIGDLDERGLLDTTLIVATGEFGRTPTVNRDGGRDHWPDCYTTLLAGGGVQGGAVYGASDRTGAFPAADPVTPADLAATIFWRFGIDPQTLLQDMTGRPHQLTEGTPLRRLF